MRKPPQVSWPRFALGMCVPHSVVIMATDVLHRPDALRNLVGIAAGSFDCAVMDGNHEATYLREELARVRELLRPDGLIMLDDVFDWRSLNIIAHELEASQETSLVQRDGRLGIWQLERTR